MKRIKVVILYLILSIVILLSPSALLADSGVPGYFMEMGLGARALGMGNSGVSLIDDASSIFINPALLRHNNQRKEIKLMYISLYEDTQYNSLSLGIPLLSKWGLGLAYGGLTSEKFIRRDNNNFPQGEFIDKNEVLYLSSAYEINSVFFLGTNFKIIRKDFDELKTSGFDADLACFWHINKMLNMGINLQNLVGFDVARKYLKEKIPMNLKAGIGINFLDKLSLAADFNQKFSLGFEDILTGVNFLKEINFGAEYKISNLSIRTGYNGYINAGVGLNLRTLLFDYALFYQKDLGISHRVSAGLRWGKSIGEFIEEEKIRQKEIRERNEEIKALLQDAEVALNFGDWQIAYDNANRILKLDKENLRAKEIIKIIEPKMGEIDILHKEAFQHIELRNWEEAGNKFSGIIKLAPDNKKAGLYLQKITEILKQLGEIKKIAIFPLEVKEGISLDEADKLGSMVEEGLVNLKKFKVRANIGDIRRMLEEKKIQACTSNECIIEVGGVINVRKAISGIVYKDRITLRLLDINTFDNEWVKNIYFDVSEKEKWPGIVDELIKDLVGKQDLLEKEIEDKIFKEVQ